MASTTTAMHMNARDELRAVDYDIDDAANLVVLDPASGDKCLAIAQFRRFRVLVFRSVGTGTVDSLKLIAATSAAGAGQVTIVAHAIGSAPNAVGDYIVLECDAEQVHEVLATATHIGVELDLATATDECVVVFQRAEPMFPRAGLTADYIS